MADAAGLNLCNLHLAQTLGLRYTGELMHPVRAADGEGGEEWDVADGVLERWVAGLPRSGGAAARARFGEL